MESWRAALLGILWVYVVCVIRKLAFHEDKGSLLSHFYSMPFSPEVPKPEVFLSCWNLLRRTSNLHISLRIILTL